MGEEWVCRITGEIGDEVGDRMGGGEKWGRRVMGRKRKDGVIEWVRLQYWL